MNAEGLSGDAGRITTELIDGRRVLATGEVLNQDGVAVRVRWTSSQGTQGAMPGTVRLRFRLAGQARLYGFTFR